MPGGIPDHLGPKGARLDLRLSDPGFDWADWFTDLAARKV